MAHKSFLGKLVPQLLISKLAMVIHQGGGFGKGFHLRVKRATFMIRKQFDGARNMFFMALRQYLRSVEDILKLSSEPEFQFKGE